MQDTFTLQEIANWQLDNEKSLVTLPSIQRGFVWKPKQVEDLWDSILRGYPIGSFLFSKTGENLYLMDGQQRATAIFLGHFNPFNTNKTIQAWSIKGELPIVWIDIKPDSKPNNSKYLLRLTTRSHPWGYQANDNAQKLSVPNRRQALEIFRKHPENQGNYTAFKNSNVFPFDCKYPLPLAFFIESANIEEVINQAEKYLPDCFATSKGNFENKNAFIKLLKENLTNELYEIWNTVNHTTKHLIIKSNIIDNNVLNEEHDAENPTLFVRINSAGTTLTGDDLIYSIYKASFSDAKNLIEKIGINFIAPTQVLSMVSRIVASDLDNSNYVKKMNVRDFQRKIKNADFKETLKQKIENEELEKVFEKAITILYCKDNALFEGEIPPVIIKQFIRKNQELFLFFVYWLHINNTIQLNDQIKLKMVAKLFSFAWFNFANIQRLWNEKIKNTNFWEESLNELIWWDGKEGINFITPPDLLRNYYLQTAVEKMFLEVNQNRGGLVEGVEKEILPYYNAVKSQEFELETANEYFRKCISNIQYNKQFILFAQREYINSIFGDYNQIEDMEDTNTPWDWDHIYPSSWVYNQNKVPTIVREWNWNIGNFRAISLEQNRSESNHDSPKSRLADDTNRKSSFILNNDWEYWQKINDRIYDKDKDKAINHFRAITTRMINIYETFWNDLKISELIKYKK